MKWIGLLFPMFLFSTCTKQFCVHNGNYGYHNYDETITLKRNGRFEYWNNRGLIETIGYGDYKIVEDSLKLLFEQTKLKLRFVDSTFVRKDKKRIELDLWVLNNNKDAVISYSLAGYDDDQLVEGNVGDFNGKVHVSLPYYGKPIKFLFSCIGHKRRYFMVDNAGKYKFISVLDEENNGLGHTIQDEIWQYKIQRMTKDSLVIIKGNGNIQSFYRCKINSFFQSFSKGTS